MTTNIKTTNGNNISVTADGIVTVDNVVISFEPEKAAPVTEQIALHALKKIASFQFGDRGYSTIDSRQIRRVVLDALRNMGAK